MTNEQAKRSLSQLMLEASALGERKIGRRVELSFYDPATVAEPEETDVKLWGVKYVYEDANGEPETGMYYGEADTPEDAVRELIEDVHFSDLLNKLRPHLAASA